MVQHPMVPTIPICSIPRTGVLVLIVWYLWARKMFTNTNQWAQCKETSPLLAITEGLVTNAIHTISPGAYGAKFEWKFKPHYFHLLFGFQSEIHYRHFFMFMTDYYYRRLVYYLVIMWYKHDIHAIFSIIAIHFDLYCIMAQIILILAPIDIICFWTIVQNATVKMSAIFVPKKDL